MGKKSEQQKAPTHTRSNYVAPSQQFSDWVTDLDLEKSFLGRWILYLDRRYGIKKLATIFGYCLLLSFILLIELGNFYLPDVGQPATRDVVSAVTLDVVDERATREKQAQEELMQPPIFDFDPSINDDLLAQLPESFERMRFELRRIQGVRAKSAESSLIARALQIDFERVLGRSVPEPSFKWLLGLDFNPTMESLLSNSVTVWKSEKLISNLNDFVPKSQKAIALRDSTKKEPEFERINKFALKDLQNREDFNYALHIFGFDQLSAQDQSELDRLTRALLLPNLTYNKKETDSVKSKAREAVLPVVIAVKKNQPIVKEGQIAKPIHLYILSKIEEHQDQKSAPFRVLTIAALMFTLIMVFLSYTRRFTLNRVRIDNKDVSLMGMVGLLVVVITKAFLLISEHILAPYFKTTIPEDFFMYLAPVASGTMMVGLLITAGEVVWLFSLFIAVVLAFIVEFDFAFLVFALSGSIVAARAVFGCKSRNDVYLAGLRVGLVNAITVLLTTLVMNWTKGLTTEIVWYVSAAFGAGILSALTTMMLIPLIETAFNVTTDVKLMELSNLNHPLLKAMIVKAPGTYHHSLIVGAMCEAAGDEIGANSLLAKVMSYYHDIGKMDHAQYFIENQRPDYNPHDQISPYMSKTILVAHVKDGAELGMKHKLGKPIIDGILQHHGTTLISFFYNKALESQDEDIDQVNEEDFRYPGPKPQFREAALVMLADSVEAAARSLDDPTPSRLQNIVKNIIHRKFTDGQLDECDLTLKDLTVIEQCFNRVLLGVYHQRIDYPKRAGGGASETPTEISKWTPRSGRGPANA